MATCDLCPETVADEDMVDHLRLLHPDMYDPVETWPDGRRVIIDETLAPDDFDHSETGPDQGILLGMGRPVRSHRHPKPPAATGFIGVSGDLPRRADGTLKPAPSWPALMLVVAFFVGLAWAVLW